MGPSVAILIALMLWVIYRLSWLRKSQWAIGICMDANEARNASALADIDQRTQEIQREVENLKATVEGSVLDIQRGITYSQTENYRQLETMFSRIAD